MGPRETPSDSQGWNTTVHEFLQSTQEARASWKTRTLESHGGEEPLLGQFSLFVVYDGRGPTVLIVENSAPPAHGLFSVSGQHGKPLTRRPAGAAIGSEPHEPGGKELSERVQLRQLRSGGEDLE